MATATHPKINQHPQSVCFQSRLNVDSLTKLCGAIRVPAPSRGRSLKVVCDARKNDGEPKIRGLEGSTNQLSCVMKFGGSSVASADGMKEVAELILSFPEENPVIVLSAMGKTTNKLILAGEKAASCVSDASEIDELSFVKELHYRTVDELELDRSIITDHLEKLERLLNGICALKELTPRSRDYLVSFGECMSTRIFAAYLNKAGVKARQYDAFDIGFITTDDFTNVDILEATYPAVANRLHDDWINDPAIPIVTGFLGKGWRTCAITTLGRGGSDLTATTIGKGLGLREIQVWKDVDGVLTCDPNIYPGAEPVPYSTFDEAAELAYFGAQVLHPQSMRPASDSDIPVRVKNSYNCKAPGTLITKSRDMSKVNISLKVNDTQSRKWARDLQESVLANLVYENGERPKKVGLLGWPEVVTFGMGIIAIGIGILGLFGPTVSSRVFIGFPRFLFHLFMAFPIRVEVINYVVKTGKCRPVEPVIPDTAVRDPEFQDETEVIL